MQSPLSVVVVDDHEMVADALVHGLSRADGMDVVGRAGTVADSVRVVADTQPAVVVTDYRLPDGTGADVAAGVARMSPSTSVVLISYFEDVEAVRRAIEAGCVGFVSKREPLHRLAHAVRMAAQGEVVMPPAMVSMLAAGKSQQRRVGDDVTAREIEVLELLVAGRSTDEIVETLALSPHTVRNHIRNILGKLHAHSRLEAVAVALREGIVRVDSQSC